MKKFILTKPIFSLIILLLITTYTSCSKNSSAITSPTPHLAIYQGSNTNKVPDTFVKYNRVYAMEFNNLYRIDTIISKNFTCYLKSYAKQDTSSSVQVIISNNNNIIDYYTTSNLILSTDLYETNSSTAKLITSKNKNQLGSRLSNNMFIPSNLYFSIEIY
jgi:hypothetical protein